MAGYSGAAQTSLASEMSFITVVKKKDHVTASFPADVDYGHCGAQIIVDLIAKDVDPPIPAAMQNNPQDCNVYLCVGKERQQVGSFVRLSQCGDAFTKAFEGQTAILLILPSEVDPYSVDLSGPDVTHPTGSAANIA